MREIAILPQPTQVIPLEGTFEIGPTTRILVSESTRAVGETLHELLQTATGFPLPVIQGMAEKNEPAAILLTSADADTSLGEEGYELSVTAGGVVLFEMLRKYQARRETLT